MFKAEGRHLETLVVRARIVKP